MIRSEKRLRLCRTLIVLLLCFIWGNSLMPAELSQVFSDWVKALLLQFSPGDSPVTEGSGLLRKLAHFFEFAALGMSLSWLFGMLEKRKIWPLLCGFGAACVDETIQWFVPDRGPSLRDVGIDTCGVIAGMLLLLAGHYVIKRSKQKEKMQ